MKHIILLIIIYLPACTERHNHNKKAEHGYEITLQELENKLASDNHNNFGNNNYFPFGVDNVLELGRGFNPFHLDEPKLIPFDFEIKNETNNAVESNFEISFVYSREQLEKSLDFSSSLNFSIGSFSGNAFYKTVTKNTFDASSVTVVIKAYSEFSKSSLHNLRMKEEATALLAKSPNGFFLRYGTRVPIIMRKGVSVYFVLNIKNASETFKNEITSNLSVSKSGLFFSAKLEASLKKEITTSNSQSRLDIQVLSRGGAGISSLANVVSSIKRDENNFDNVKTEIASYFKDLNIQTAVPIGYYSSTYKDLGYENAISENLSFDKETFLKKIIDYYNTSLSDIERMTLVSNGSDPLSQTLSKDKLLKIKNEYIGETQRYVSLLRLLYYKYIDVEPGNVDFDTISIPQSPAHNILKGMDITMTINNEVTDTRDTNNTFQFAINAPYLQSVKFVTENDLNEGSATFNLLNAIQLLDLKQADFPFDLSSYTNGERSGLLVSRDSLLLTSSFFYSQWFIGKFPPVANENGLNFYIEITGVFGNKRIFRIGKIYQKDQYKSVYLYKAVNQ